MTDFKLRQQRAHYHYTIFQECCHDPKGSFSARKDPPLPFGQCMRKRNVGEASRPIRQHPPEQIVGDGVLDVPASGSSLDNVCGKKQAADP